MLREKILYGEREVDVDLPDDTRVVNSSWYPYVKAAENPQKLVVDALKNPVDSPRVSELAKGAKKVTIVFDDPAKAPSGPPDLREMAISAIMDELREAGLTKRNMILVCGNSMHRKWTRKELSWLVGEKWVAEFGPRLICHDAEDKENLAHLGITNSGYELEINKHAVDADLVISINAGHFRGLNGGWKTLIVGCGTWRSMRTYHGPDQLSASIRKNPMHEALNEMADQLKARSGKKYFKIDTVSGPEGISHVFAGDTNAVHEKSFSVISAHAPPKKTYEDKADVLVFGIPNYAPYAIFSGMNPILTLLAMGLGYIGGITEALARPGCSVIMATPCEDVWDEVYYPGYQEIWEKVLSRTLDAHEIHEVYGDALANRPDYIYKYRYGYGFHVGHGLFSSYSLTKLNYIGKVFVAGPEDPKLPRHLGFEPTRTVEEALHRAQMIHGKDCKVTFYKFTPPTIALQHPELYRARRTAK